jgi:membrane protease YdiL (CAAX protease family)
MLFALAHTQTFQQSCLTQFGSSSVHIVHTTIERLFNVFAIALALALLLVWTRSILPGAIVHAILNSGIKALPFVQAIYFSIVFWAYRRGDRIAFGVGTHAD